MDFSALKGMTLTAVNVHEDDNEITFVTEDNRLFRMWHMQDCCEHVYLEDVAGDWADVIGVEILVAEASVSDEAPEDTQAVGDDSQTWTFYKLATIKGSVDFRWFGSSNGYYSESVDFEEYTP